MIIKFIDCTEQHHEQMDSIVLYLQNYLDRLNIKHFRLKLSEMKVVRCTRCRLCTQKVGFEPVKCYLDDEMNNVIDSIEEANAYIILADRNSLFKRNDIHAKFSERLVAYYYWPFGKGQSTPRKIFLEKKSILINYNTTKYFMNHSFYTSKVNMTHTSTAIGAKVVDWLALTPNSNKDLVKEYKNSLDKIITKLLGSLKQEPNICA